MNKQIESKSSAGLTKNASGHFVRLEDVETMIATAKDEVLKAAKVEIDKQVQTDKAFLIAVFGIFASVLSFLTIEFQFLRVLSHIDQVIGFSLLLFALLLGFNLALDYLATRRLGHARLAYFSVLLLVIIAFGLGLFFMGRKL